MVIIKKENNENCNINLDMPKNPLNEIKKGDGDKILDDEATKKLPSHSLSLSHSADNNFIFGTIILYSG